MTNDDGWCHKSNLYDVHRPHYHNIGWAVAQIRAQNDALKAAGYNVRPPPAISAGFMNSFTQVVLSCPAINKSGTGSSTATPTKLTSPCEFNTCPTGSPATGFNASDTRLNYVNAFPGTLYLRTSLGSSEVIMVSPSRFSSVWYPNSRSAILQRFQAGLRRLWSQCGQ